MQNIIAAVRTAVQNLLTVAIVSLIAWLASFGIEITIGPEVIESLSAGVTVVIGAVLVGVWTWIQRKLEERFPILVPILSLGLARTGPEYVEGPVTT